MADARKLSKKIRRSRARSRPLKPRPVQSAASKPEMAAQARASEMRKLRSARAKVSTKVVSASSAATVAALERSVSLLVKKLPTMSYAELLKIWRNALRHPLGTASSASPPARMIKAIEEEWDRRGAAHINPHDHFAWPSTDAPGGTGQLVFSATLPEGMLDYLDYHVGRTRGEVASVRRAILARIFVGKLPPVFPVEYLNEWGTPATSIRLRKLAETIAAFVRNSKRRHDERMDDAIAEWESDLGFLYDEYYIGRFHFGWPETAV